MGISLKQLLPLLMAAILFATGSLIAVGSIFYFYHDAVQEMISAKTTLLGTVAAAMQGKDRPQQDAIMRAASRTPDIAFFRLIDTTTGVVLLSAKQPDEVGAVSTGVPGPSEDAVAVNSAIWNAEPFAEISTDIGKGEMVWLRIDLGNLYQRTLSSVILAVLAVFTVITVGYAILYALLQWLLMRPIGRLIRSIALEDRNLPQDASELKIRELIDLSKSIKEMKRRFGEALERESTISRIKSDFLTVATHRLRTPISGIKWALKTLEDPAFGTLSDDQKDILEKAYQANERMVRLIDDLLDVARIEEGKFGYEFEYANLVEVVRSVMDEHRPVYGKKRIALALREPHKEIPNIKIDIPKIKMVVETLLTNALTYTPAGGSVEVSVSKKDNDFAEISVYDTGIGIPQSDTGRIFTKFFRGKEAIKLDTEGTGLGLYIAKNIVANHGGTIGIESKEGVGTTVSLTLPLHEKLIPEKEKTFEEFMRL